MADYYVTTSGSDSNTGLSESLAFASPGKACATATTSGDRIFVKSGTYTLTSTTNNANGGRFTLALGVRMEGYNSTIGDLGTAPVISAGSLTSFTMCTIAASFNVRPAQLVNIEFNGQSNSTVVGVNNTAQYTRFINKVLARNCTTGFSGLLTDGCLFNCSAISCGTGFLNQCALIGCIARTCSSFGFDKYQTAVHCIAANNGNTGFRSFNAIGSATVNCTSHGNTNYGFDLSYDIGIIGNCIATSNTLHGYSLGGSSPNGMPCFNNANWNNTSGANRFTSAVEIGQINLSANPFTDSTNLDFTLNNTAGGGALLRSAGFPGSIQGGSTGFLDVGCYQASAGGGGGGLILPRPMNGGYSA